MIIAILICVASITIVYAERVFDTRFGAIRWDDWAGPQYGPTALAPIKCLGPEEFHYRVPWCGKVINSSAVTWEGATQSVIDKEIQFAAAGGVDFWEFVIYPFDATESDCANSIGPICPLSLALDAYLKSDYKHLVNFSMILQADRYVNASEWKSVSLPRFEAYFKDISYETVSGNKALVYWFNVHTSSISKYPGGAEEFATRLKDLETAAMRAGRSGVHASLMQGDDSFFDLGFDSVSTYAVFGGSPSGQPFSDLVNNAKSYWTSQAHPLIPPVSTGWDPRPRDVNPPPWEPNGEGKNYFNQGTPEDIAALVQEAMYFVGNNSDKVPANVVSMYAWNENTEGGWINPTLFNGTDRLDAIAKVIRT